ncbi:decaprenyl-phosphate phosphoribosyltransferase [bacterium]|nr:decaprenyl-phosphate phosphoribosyltransferase [bacterium]
MTAKLLDLLIAARPRQWVKNLFVFAAPVFAVRFVEPEVMLRSLLAFFALSCASSGVYLVNDVVDRDADRQHPDKRKRPLAAGRLSVTDCALLALGFWIVAAALLLLLRTPAAIVVVIAYIALNLAYSLYFKHKVVIDVLLLALGFVLRVLLGGVANHIEVSPWLILCTFLLAMFLGFSKRRHELLVLENNAHMHRRILSEYEPYFLDQMIAVTTASTFLSYCLYTILTPTFQYMEATIPFVAYGILRYLYLVHRREKGGDPTEVVLSDRGLLLNLLLWIVLVFALAGYSR